MTSNARVPAAEITGLFGATVKRMCMKRLGQVPESLGVIWHHKPVLKAFFGFSAEGGEVGRSATSSSSRSRTC